MTTGSYTAATLAQAQTAVLQRLSDSSGVHWTTTEITRYLQEAIRTWNAYTMAFRDSCVFSSVEDQTFYDLPTVAPTERGQTLTDADAINLLCYHLEEPIPTGSTWNGSSQFALTDLVQAIQRRRDQFLVETSSVVVNTPVPVISPPPDGRIALSELVVTLRRAAWITVDGAITPLFRDDEWSANAYQPAWVQTPAATPRVISVGVTPPLYAQVIPPPLDSGVLDLCIVQRGAALGLTLDTTPTPLGIPNDWAWVVVFGALADLLNRDGLALDPGRGAYAEARWTQGIALASAASVVLTARIDNVICGVAALPDADTFSRSWQTTSGTPRRVLTLGQTLVALAPPPDAGDTDYAITLDVVRNAPVPTASVDYLQIGAEYLDTIYDYAQHLALIKEGGQQLQTSMEILNRFMAAARVQSTWQKALTPQRQALLEQTVQDRRGANPSQVPLGLTGAGTGAAGAGASNAMAAASAGGDR